MSDFRFSLIVPATRLTEEEILDATDTLAGAGCGDASIRGHQMGIELMFQRTADSLESALATAVRDVENAGYRVSKVELEREAIGAPLH